MANQGELIELILFKESKTTGESVPYNEELRRLHACLRKFKYEPSELEIIKQAIMAELPKWRVKQITAEKEAVTNG